MEPKVTEILKRTIMKRLLTVLAILIFASSFAGAQIVTERCWHLDKVQFLEHRQDFWRSHKLFTTAPNPSTGISGGFYNLTEAQYGFGLAGTEPPFSNHYAGVTMVNGWRFGNGLAVGVGVGYYGYNDGYGIPLYGDVRYYIGRQKNQIFLMGSGGFLMNFENFKDFSRVFFNPGAGLIIPVAKSVKLSFAVGLLTQYNRSYFEMTDPWGRYRDSFINMKLGLMFGK